jgi:hypothetical protein
MVMQELKRLSAFIDYRRKGNEALSDQFVAAPAFFRAGSATSGLKFRFALIAINRSKTLTSIFPDYSESTL